MTRARSLAIRLFAVLCLAATAAFAQPAVTGTVLGAGKKPMAGARAELLPLSPIAAPVAAAETDKAGRFSLRAPEPGLWKVVVRGPETVPLQLSPLPLVEPVELPPAVLSSTAPASRPSPGEWAPASISGDREPQSPARAPLATLSGRVLDGARRPLAGALVWASADPAGFVRSDREGRFRLPVQRRWRFDVEVLAPGHLPKRTAIQGAQLAAGRSATISLTRAAAIHGNVVDPKGRPLSAVMVVAIAVRSLGERSFDPSDPATDRAVTDAQGRFELRRLRPVEGYAVRASRTGNFPAEHKVTAGDPAASPRQVTLILAPARAARGRVQDVERRPLAGAEVEVRPALRPSTSNDPSPPDEEMDVAAQSDAQGNFQVAELPANEVEIVVRKKGFAPISLPAVRIPAGTGPADLGAVTLRPGATLAGRVVDTRKQAVAGAEVFALDRPARVNEVDRFLQKRKPAATARADGCFRIDDLAKGTPVHLVVRAPSYLPALVRAVRPPTAEPLVVRLEPEAALRGWVVDADGKPVAGARIGLRWQDILPEDPELRVGTPVIKAARSDADGRFEVRGLPFGTVNLGVSAPGFVPVEDVETRVPRPAETEELRIVLERGAVLRGRVTLGSGDPVAAARVGVGGASAATDDDGFYWLEGAPLGRRDVLVVHPSHGRLVKPFEIQPGVNVLDLAFEPGVEVAGRVVDEDGKPVPGARVDLGAERRFDLKEYRGVTNDHGRFQLSPVADGRYRLKAAAEGFAEAELPGAVEVAGQPVDTLEIILSRGATLSGNILGLSAEDLATVDVIAIDETGYTRAAWTDGRGRYEIRPLFPGDWTVRAKLFEGQREAQVRLVVSRSDREVTRDLEFDKRLTLSVQVLYDDEPLPDARVTLSGSRLAGDRSALTDHEGRFRFDDLEPDTYHLGVNHPGKMIVHNDQVELQGDQEVVLRLQIASVGGVVVSKAGGEAIPDAIVSLRPVDGPEFLVATGTKADGRFRMHRVPPGRYSLDARADGFTPAPPQEVQVAAGQSLEDLEFRLDPTQGAKLQVRLASGKASELVHVQVRNPATGMEIAESVLADPSGNVELATLPSGAWDLLIRAEGGAVATATLLVPSEPLAITLPPAGKLKVRVPALVPLNQIATIRLLDSGQQPFWTLGMGGKIEQQWQLLGGNGTIDGVPPGAWTLQVDAPDGQRWTGTATTSGAGETTVTLQ